MKQLLLMSCAIGMATGTIMAESSKNLEDLAKRQCRSIHLSWANSEKIKEGIELYYMEMKIQQSANGSYFMATGFNGGYFGLQQLFQEDRKIAIFSVWEPSNGQDLTADQAAVPEDERVKVLASGKNVYVTRFGNEGTGGKSKIPFQWKIGETHRFIVTAKPGEKPEGTIFSGYIYLPEEKKWSLMATFHTKLKVKRLKELYSFVEDFRRNYKSATQTRKADFGNGWVRTTSGKWHPLNKTIFTADPTPSMNINTGKVESPARGFFMQTGGNTENKVKLWTIQAYNLDPKKEITPPKDIINFPKP